MTPLARTLLGRGLTALVLCCAAGCTTHPAASSPAASTTIRVLDVDGAPRGLWPIDRSPITVVVFTRTDCPVSNRFAPEIRSLHESWHPRGVEFYLVYVDPREQPAAIRKHLSDYRYPCGALRDPEHTLVAYCHATTTPEAAVFNQDHDIVYLGRISDLYADLGNRRPDATRHDLAEAIAATVEGRPVATPRTSPVGCVIADLKN